MKNKVSAGMIAGCVTFVCALLGFILYLININASGYFQGGSVPQAQLFVILSMVTIAIAICLYFVKVKGIAGKIADIAGDILSVVSPVLLSASLMTLVGSRVEGFAFIYFSNADVLTEVQTPANLSSAHVAIANIVVMAIAIVAGIVWAFLGKKKNEEISIEIDKA
ncbi:MAG: hypothetical protein K6G87_07835 [Butyrivibrio sp.]|uniref:hypothetical protein n=1 Tax=Butyrivibrio sp. TaxID=28121 RepID=UPI0025E6C3BF|nr:hypothetical protein [Butyrivibrio sp.]MCR5771121.1 hypothetical protein [Butyrivibrio sp.]